MQHWKRFTVPPGRQLLCAGKVGPEQVLALTRVGGANTFTHLISLAGARGQQGPPISEDLDAGVLAPQISTDQDLYLYQWADTVSVAWVTVVSNDDVDTFTVHTSTWSGSSWSDPEELSLIVHGSWGFEGLAPVSPTDVRIVFSRSEFDPAHTPTEFREVTVLAQPGGAQLVQSMDLNGHLLLSDGRTGRNYAGVLCNGTEYLYLGFYWEDSQINPPVGDPYWYTEPSFVCRVGASSTNSAVVGLEPQASHGFTSHKNFLEREGELYVQGHTDQEYWTARLTGPWLNEPPPSGTPSAVLETVATWTPPAQWANVDGAYTGATVGVLVADKQTVDPSIVTARGLSRWSDAN